MRLFKQKVNRRRRSKGQALAEGVRTGGMAAGKIVPWVLLVAVLVGLPVLLVQGWRYGLQSSWFHIDTVDIHGAEQARVEEIHEAIGYRGDATNIFTIDPIKAAERLETEVPWVLSATVDREVPSTITIEIVERELGGIALIGDLMLVDKEGVPFKMLEHESGMDRAVVTGQWPSLEEMTPLEYGQIKEALQIVDLYDTLGLSAHDRLAEVHVDPVAGFSLITEKRGVRVLLGEGMMERRLERLGEVFVTLDRRKMQTSLIRLDGERSVRRVAIRPIEGGAKR